MNVFMVLCHLLLKCIRYIPFNYYYVFISQISDVLHKIKIKDISGYSYKPGILFMGHRQTV